MSKTSNRMWEIIKEQYKVFKEYKIKNDANIPVPRAILEARLRAEQNSRPDSHFGPVDTGLSVRDCEMPSPPCRIGPQTELVKKGQTEKKSQFGKNEINGYSKVGIRIDVDLETVASPGDLPNAELKSTDETKRSAVWLDLDELMGPMRRDPGRVRFKGKGSILSDYNEDLTRNTNVKMPAVYDPKNAINVDDERPQPTVTSEEGEPVYIWPEPPKMRVINLEPRKQPLQVVGSRGKKDSKVDLRVLAKGFNLLKTYPRALETIKYISVNKYKLTKNCQPEVFVKDLRCLGSYDHRLSLRNRFKYLKNVISCDDPIRRRPAKKTRRVRKKTKKERKFTVKMQNLYIS